MAQQAGWSADVLARNCGVSLRTLERFFLKEMDKSPKAWLREQRLQLAGRLLQKGSSVKEAAGNLDYKHVTHFSRDFKVYWGCCPAEKSVPIRAQKL